MVLVRVLRIHTCKGDEAEGEIGWSCPCNKDVRLCWRELGRSYDPQSCLTLKQGGYTFGTQPWLPGAWGLASPWERQPSLAESSF